MIAIFSSDPQVLALARPLLALGAFFQLVDAVGIVAAGALRGAGDTRWPFVMQATLAWALRLPLVYLFAVVLDGGVFGAWAGELVHVGALGVALALRFRSGQWRTIRDRSGPDTDLAAKPPRSAKFEPGCRTWRLRRLGG